MPPLINNNNKIICNRCKGKLRFALQSTSVSVYEVDPENGDLLETHDHFYTGNTEQSIFCPQCDGETSDIPNSILNEEFECADGYSIVRKDNNNVAS